MVTFGVSALITNLPRVRVSDGLLNEPSWSRSSDPHSVATSVVTLPRHGRRGRISIDKTNKLCDYIEGFYNPQRIQKRLGYRSPAEYEAMSVAQMNVHVKAGQHHSMVFSAASWSEKGPLVGVARHENRLLPTVGVP